MSAHTIGAACAALVLLGLPASADAANAVGSAKPNIILIVADDLGWADIAYQGPKTRGLHETPHLDRLASEGLNLDDNGVAERMTTASIDFITRNRGHPFFLYLAHYEPHGPLTAKADRIEYYRKKFASLGNTERHPIYAAMVEEVDRSTGQLLAAVKSLGLEENTLVIFTSDNGGWVDLPEVPNNYPLRGTKGNFYEGGIRTPGIVKWPAVVRAGSRSDYPVHGVDLMPTLAAVTGVPVPTTQPVDGVSILPLLKGQPMAERALFFHFPLYLGGAPLPVHG